MILKVDKYIRAEKMIHCPRGDGVAFNKEKVVVISHAIQ